MTKNDLKAALFAGWMILVLIAIVVAIYMVVTSSV
jgi:hypothetical protein